MVDKLTFVRTANKGWNLPVTRLSDKCGSDSQLLEVIAVHVIWHNTDKAAKSLSLSFILRSTPCKLLTSLSMYALG